MNLIEEKIIARCKEIRQELITAIQQIVQIPSIKSVPLDDAPYGKAIKQALEHTLSLANSFGFETYNIENQVGFAQWGNKHDYVGVMGHLDVVEVEDGWLVPPFSGKIVEDKIISRGVLDNKGPIYTNLFALKVVKEICEEENIDLPLSIRIIFGCDEESGFHDVPHYLTNERPPKYGYTPDCKYPPVYSERGRLRVKLSSSMSDMDVFSIVLTDYFLAANDSGDRLGIATEHIEYGKLEIRGFQLASADKLVSFTFSISYPPTITYDQLIKNIQHKLSNYPIIIEVISNWQPVVFDKTHPQIKIMSQSYQDVTSMDGTPVTTTGGTYAKLIPNIVPFGPSFPGQKGIAHQPNEYWDLDDIFLNLEIYALTMYRLAQLG
ncbi:M20/M25/M40 family metallo-hydrolase [Globicatella sp. PHS-GS-PNBC-21-1553]|uniref:M20/M25/M40 family metallo-hydrolase n=1 Tax=Globicatella sp. PHS-GS-PNBC-21-1553 TaxID=2885764 RepID=UPI00298ED528|nr:M20/M25/M40 family metallo-hydrolase [Globicatella sp. PHS-GS-PNBC-21-1553]WPC09050.1 M20/M25/M40 family metallo-hydrolase [Globicatella sp. PHS-GS-PNBC-21-1553]